MHMHIQIHSLAQQNCVKIWHYMKLAHGCQIKPDILRTSWHMVKEYRSKSQISSQNKRQCSTRKVYYSCELSTREAQRCVVL